MHGCVVLPDVEDNIMQFMVPRGNILAYWPHSHGIFVYYYTCHIHSILTLVENGKCSVDWFVADEIGMSTNNGGCCKFPNLHDPKHFIK